MCKKKIFTKRACTTDCQKKSCIIIDRNQSEKNSHKDQSILTACRNDAFCKKKKKGKKRFIKVTWAKLKLQIG